MGFNVTDFASRVTYELDNAVRQKPVTSMLIDDSLADKFVGVKTLMIPTVEFSGLGDYSRETGFREGTVSVTSVPHVLMMDRGRSFQIDREALDESGMADLVGTIMGEFVRTKVVPEIDAYVISKLAQASNDHANNIYGDHKTDAFSMLSEAIFKVQGTAGFDEELIAFVNNEMWSALQNSTELNRLLVINDTEKGELNTRVFSFNGVKICPVQSYLMKKEFSFLNGTVNEEKPGGFVPTDGTANVGFVVFPRRVASVVKKTEQVRCFDPAHNPNADAWKFDYRLYYDVLLKDALAGSICAYTYYDE